MIKSKLKQIIKSKAFKLTSISILAGCSIGGSYILGFESAKGLPATYKIYPSSKTLAIVGDTKIKVEVLEKYMEMYFAYQPLKELSKDEIYEKEQTYIDYIVTREGLKQRAIKEGLTVADEVVSSQYEDLVSKIENMYGLTIEECFKKYDISEELIKESVHDELLGNAYLDKIGITSDEEIQKYFDEHPEEFVKCSASHILIKTIDDNFETLPEEEVIKAKKKAQEILEKALNGEDFATLAKTYSEDASAEDGGDLGEFGKGEMVKEFEEAAFALETGQITSSLVKTEFGYHIIKKTGESVSTFEDSKDSIRDNIVYNKKLEELKSILDSSDVKVVYGK